MLKATQVSINIIQPACDNKGRREYFKLLEVGMLGTCKRLSYPMAIRHGNFLWNIHYSFSLL